MRPVLLLCTAWLATAPAALAAGDQDTDSSQDTAAFMPSGGRTVQCGTSPVPAALGLGALLALGLLSRRRRHQPLIVSLLAGAMLVGPVAKAAPLVPAENVQRFAPSGLSSGFVTIYSGRQLDSVRFSFDAIADYGWRPLQRSFQVRDTLIRDSAAIEHLTALHLRAAVGVKPWFQIALSAPALQFAATGVGLDTWAGPRDTSLAYGDLALELGFRPLSEDDDGVGMTITPFVTAPTGLKRYLLTDGVPTFGARVAMSGVIGPAHLAAFAGYKVKVGSARLGPYVAIDDEVVYGAGAGFTLVPDWLRLNAELNGNSIVGPGRKKITRTLVTESLLTGLEANANLLLTTPTGFAMVLGGGAGLTATPGVPAARGFLGLSYLPITRSDPDSDGIRGAADACPQDPEDMDGFEDLDGCPDLDNDGDGVPDLADHCPSKAEDADGDEDEDGCPDDDGDRDGVDDAHDDCPKQPEDVDQYKDEDGCPDPDNDGDHVPDTVDECPNDAEDRDGNVDDDGCPDNDDDGDGIPDTRDNCPLDAEDFDGDADEDGCPEDAADSDSDGLLDVADKCPKLAEDRDGFEDEDGCPDADNDGDGILDVADLCPRAPETLNGFKDDDGCPDETKATLEGNKIVITDTILFYFNEARIKEESFPVLDAVKGVVLAHPEIVRLRVEGHTDSQGSDAYNQDLSERRALAVRQYLIDHGIESTRLLARGYGERYPIAPNGDETGRAKNRRVEFIVLKPEDDGGADASDVLDAGSAAPEATTVRPHA